MTGPRVRGEVFVAEGARVEGDVELGAATSIWFGATVRADGAPIVVDDGANIQDNCVVESRPGHPTRIGRDVSVGHNARIFGAVVEDRALIAIGAEVRVGAHIGVNSIVGAHAVVPEGMRVPDRSLVIGEGRILREVSDAEIARIDYGAGEYRRLTVEYRARLGSRL